MRTLSTSNQLWCCYEAQLRCHGIEFGCTMEQLSLEECSLPSVPNSWIKIALTPRRLQVLEVVSKLLQINLKPLVRALLNDNTFSITTPIRIAMSPKPTPCCDAERWQQTKAPNCSHKTWYNKCKRIDQWVKPLQLMTDDEVSCLSFLRGYNFDTDY